MRDVVSYMNTFGEKQYTKLHASLIASAISKEYKDRRKCGEIINTKTKLGREQLNIKIAEIVNNSTLTPNFVTPKDVWIYKKANALEYQDRTGKCMWGFKEKRRAYGYDEITGKELS